MSKTSVFISYDGADIHSKNQLLIWNKDHEINFDFYAGPLKIDVTSHDASSIKSLIRPQIAMSNCLLCIVGLATSKNAWIGWQIDVAAENEKKLVGVKLDKDYSTPVSLRDVGATWARSFDFEAIKAAINEH